MHIYLTARHLTLTDALAAHVDRQLVDLVRSHGGHEPTRIRVQLTAESLRRRAFACHVTVELPRGVTVEIREEDDDLYAAIDLAKDRLRRRLAEHRQRRETLRRHLYPARQLAHAWDVVRGLTRRRPSET